MKIERIRIGLAIVFVVLIFLVLAGFYWSFVRDSIALPIYDLLWTGDLVLKSIPQSTYLIFLVLLCLVIGITTFQGIKAKPLPLSDEPNPAQSHTRYLLWRNAYDNLYNSRYFREQFAAESRKLILLILANQEGIEVTEAQAMVESSALPVPATILNLIKQGEIQAPQRVSNPLDTLANRVRQLLFHGEPRRDPQLDRQVTEIISFIEHLLEINNARIQPESSS